LFLFLVDSAEMAAARRRRELDIWRDVAAELGRSAVEIARTGFYFNDAGERVEIGELVARAVSAKRSLPPDAVRPDHEPRSFAETRVQVVNEPLSAPCVGSCKAVIGRWR
jgi:hypothetical protein